MRLLKGGPIRIGDITTGGGVVVDSGGGTMPVEGGGRIAEWCTIGAKAQCCGGTQTFKEGCVGRKENGLGLVLEGHLLTCGHYAISSCAAVFMVTDYVLPGEAPASDAEPAKPIAAAATPQAEEEDHWLDLRLTDKDVPLPNQRYVVTDPAGRVHEGTLDGNAYARVSPVRRGACRVDFPDLGYSTVVVV